MEVYEDNGGEFRWRCKANNGQIVGASSEGFHDEDEAYENAERLANYLYKDVNEKMHVQWCIIGMMMEITKAPGTWYRMVARDCIRYMELNDIEMSFPTAIELLRPRVEEYKKGTRKRIIDKDELISE
jgi:hypothetical protein